MTAIDKLNAALVGRYTIERRIGEGGMAIVYLGRDLRHHRPVAVKVLRPELAEALGPQRFLLEIEVMARLHHPNLLPLFDSGHADGLLFFVMPFVAGESLRARLDRQAQLPVEDAVHIAVTVARALDHAHRRGVIHRDLSPDNILLAEGEAFVADFGLALAISNAGGERLTRTGVSVGTPKYMSPEQAMAERHIDGRSDIFSLGTILYEMLTGTPPHTGPTTQAVMAKVVAASAAPINILQPSAPPHVGAALMRSLSKLPADRFGTADEFADALEDRQFARATTIATPAKRETRLSAIVSRIFAVLALGVLLGG